MEMLTDILPALAFSVMIVAQVAAVPIVRSINYSDRPPPPRQRNYQPSALDLFFGAPSAISMRGGPQAPDGSIPPAGLSPGRPKSSEAAMRWRHTEKHLHLPAHIEPATAIIDAMRWEQKDIDPRVKKMVDAAAMRAGRQYERLRRLAGRVVSSFCRPRANPQRSRSCWSLCSRQSA
jgi:hypothetical protein